MGQDLVYQSAGLGLKGIAESLTLTLSVFDETLLNGTTLVNDDRSKTL